MLRQIGRHRQHRGYDLEWALSTLIILQRGQTPLEGEPPYTLPLDGACPLIRVIGGIGEWAGA